MPINSRNKGSTFERTVAAELLALTGVTFKRNLEQARTVDHSDLTPDDAAWPFAIECKAYAIGTGCKPAWQDQATRAAALIGKIPCVIFKYNRQPIRVAMPLAAVCEAQDMAKPSADLWIETTLTVLAWVAGEIMAGRK
jgi:uncharacterized membrane protein YqaE (UPF0057 family)